MKKMNKSEMSDRILFVRRNLPARHEDRFNIEWSGAVRLALAINYEEITRLSRQGRRTLEIGVRAAGAWYELAVTRSEYIPTHEIADRVTSYALHGKDDDLSKV